MRFSRRQFIGLIGALGVSGCGTVRDQASIVGQKLKSIPGNVLPNSSDTFTFATINDTHVTDMRSTSIVGRAVAGIKADERVLFTVILGDIATDGRLQELSLPKPVFDRLEHPYFTIPGNHDVDMTLENAMDNYERVYEEGNWTEGESGWAFIGLDTTNDTASDVTVGPERMAWLEERIKRIGNQRPIALFGHHPFNPNSKAYRVQNADEVLALFAGHNLKLVASGHYHGNQIEEQDGILFTTTACCSTTRGNHDGTDAKGYRLYHITEGAIETEFIEVRV